MNPLAIPELTKHVNDHSHILSSEQVESLSQLFADHENKTTEQVVTLFIPHRKGHELLDIGLKVFNENGIGQKTLNNGLLLIVATEEKKLKIIVGKGLELKYTEMVCREIIEKHLRPLLNAGKYEEMVRKWGEIISNTPSNDTKDKRVSWIGGDQKQEIVNDKIIKSISIFSGVSTIFGLFLINGYISALIGMVVSGILFYLGYRLRESLNSTKRKLILLFPLLILVTSIIAILSPAKCTINNIYSDGKKTYNCERDIFGHQYNYTYSEGGSSSSSSSSHGSSSSSSSFGGGGGSSNGGGYGD